MDLRVIGEASIFGKLAMIVCAAPLATGIFYAVRPTERWLALMRPLSLAAIFASVSLLLLGVLNALMYMGRTTAGGPGTPVPAPVALAEALVPSFIGFACLTAAWLCVAIGVKRST